MDVRKTNGSLEEFDKAKLARGIHEAYKTAGQYCDDSIVVSIINNLYTYEGITSLEIRRQVEEALMAINKKVALAYIEKFDADLDLRKKRDFIKDYIAAKNAATGSKFDANANVTRKNIVTLGNELYKENNIKQNRYIMCDKIKSLYGRALADQYLADLDSHVLYKHDESGTPGYPYCVAITMYPFLVSGLKELGGVSAALLHDLKSICPDKLLDPGHKGIGIRQLGQLLGGHYLGIASQLYKGWPRYPAACQHFTIEIFGQALRQRTQLGIGEPIVQLLGKSTARQ